MVKKIKEFRFCYHDYKKAIPVGKIDHMCPKCLKILDPGEWFLMTNFDVVDVSSEETKRELRKKDRETSRKVISKYKFSPKSIKLIK
ncbi:MAG: hypothetical protein UR39_C0001G0074 [Candidatus Woesebacteria bacterium GW2011_GWA1_33_30]|uniref:Uncharacterized protein n=1 Tax=Candidatus Woesebacteria bacterium GW2011_GWA2_33_28 TaxID=1618561 RepID=A0A0F9ZVN0_9BACT|nr:MAG: hypothetical protein UR38_C0001G0075 [Candidatus Woesebacteria bacterium GW2011_GWA2_33_28]KKP49041.1 MAG: hypothetical protein UR39_C0001G0074 [Candidatus Woesebacteria bacterium GW2011_GWA1_33_30]KKP49851.1 MAG: hypothetical protein UR40_C0003G0023 [Microgenomates group bacterium GW2011_GWC1_33_32]KKP52633.1 MAG: hypothetical protein UR44_C0001G0075 [Candidatus Woesebacteria bacterium GW2011_GWB1_33_38]KKP58810.1 MAG: hypothetical protein UR48_C0001G0014 [Microgenomates group bacteriu